LSCLLLVLSYVLQVFALKTIVLIWYLFLIFFTFNHQDILSFFLLLCFLFLDILSVENFVQLDRFQIFLFKQTIFIVIISRLKSYYDWDQFFYLRSISLPFKFIFILFPFHCFLLQVKLNMFFIFILSLESFFHINFLLVRELWNLITVFLVFLYNFFGIFLNF